MLILFKKINSNENDMQTCLKKEKQKVKKKKKQVKINLIHPPIENHVSRLRSGAFVFGSQYCQRIKGAALDRGFFVTQSKAYVGPFCESC